jgi:DNA-binding transcriptional ArsR family regulator
MFGLDHTLDAVAHPARRAMLARLAQGNARVTEIAAPFAMSLNAVSKHLKVLEGAGLIEREKRGRDHILALRAAPLRQVSAWLQDYERYWTGRLDRLEAHFQQKRKENP